MVDVLSIRRSNPVEEVVAGAGVELRPVGRRLVGRCPLHHDAQPSLAVYPDSQSYFCFGCGAGGDVIDFVAKLHKLSFREAAALLASAGPERWTARAQVRVKPPMRIGGLTPQEAEVLDAASWLYHSVLLRSREALAYLRSRGISKETARRCRLGFADGSLASHLRKRGLGLAVARDVGLLYGETDSMLGRIVITDLRGGRATWLTGRSTDGREPRYLNVRLPTPLLGLDQIEGGDVVVTEGPFDWLTTVQWGLPAAALAGSRVSQWTLRSLSRFRRVYVALDNDDAGQRAARQLAAGLGDRVHIVRLPADVKDLNDLGLRADGRDAFMRCLKAATATKEETWHTSDAAPALRAA